jgi:hypothetical protein
MITEKTGWFKSTYSGNDQSCFETTGALLSRGVVPVRDSKDTSIPHLEFSTDVFAAFIGDVKDGVYNV